MCLACALALPAVAPAEPALDLFPGSLDALPWPEGGAAGGTIEWTGVAGFVLEAEGVRIAFDPFVSRPGVFSVLFRRARPDRALVAERFSGLSAVFVGHAHYDHAMDLAAVAEASPRATLRGGATSMELCRRLGVDPARLAVLRDGDAERVGPFRVTGVRSAHGLVPLVRFVDRLDLPAEGLPRTPFRWPRGEVLAYRVEVGGRSFHLHGSAGIDDDALARQAPCDALVACLAARKGTPRYLERLGERLRPRLLVPCHHDDFFRPLSAPPAPVATLRAGAFAREAAALARDRGTALVPLPRGGASGSDRDRLPAVALVLDRTERRVIGALLEKQLSVPEVYPLTLNSLVAACNQKNNRDPETAFTEGEVQGALHALMDRGWVTRIELAGARTVRFEHRVVEQLGVDEADAALLAELLLRGPQSVPELRSRASRMRAFSSLEEVEQRLAGLASRPVPYVRLLGKRPGERVVRWEHLLSKSGETSAEPSSHPAAPSAVRAPAAAPPTRTPPSVPPSSLEDRVAALEREVASLRFRLDSIE